MNNKLTIDILNQKAPIYTPYWHSTLWILELPVFFIAKSVFLFKGIQKAYFLWERFLAYFENDIPIDKQ